MIGTLIIAPLCTILAIIILMGKGDNLIAGYNTASKKEKEEYDIKRLRLVLGVFLLLMALASFFFLLEESIWAQSAFGVITFVLLIPTIILANSWAKKK